MTQAREKSRTESKKKGKPMTPEQQDPDEQEIRELAKKLAAACIAHRLGQKSIDNVRKRYVDGSAEIGLAWIDLARRAKLITIPSSGVFHPITTRTQ